MVPVVCKIFENEPYPHGLFHPVRRGCPSICPNGSLSTGQGTRHALLPLFKRITIDSISSRFVLADTTQLHAKIAEMGQRIRQLEDALTIFQSGVSSEVHPLLREELLSIKFGPEKGHVPDKELHQPIPDSIDAFGTMTLTVGDLGAGKYFGPSAGSEVRLCQKVWLSLRVLNTRRRLCFWYEHNFWTDDANFDCSPGRCRI